MLAKNKEHSARSKGDRRLCFERAERLAKQDAPVLFERSEFTGEYAELPTESCKLCAAARHCRGLGVKPRVCFSFAGVFFFKQKENAETRVVHIV
ncbi:MAG: hypothetical protein EGQ01_12530 [Ruminococcaceae bacterium]|nr:hypothetical protein [Oscillospiraceae bacterium]